MPNHCIRRVGICSHNVNIYYLSVPSQKSARVSSLPLVLRFCYYILELLRQCCILCFSFHFIGPPIITHRNMSLINGKVVLSIYVFSDPRITDIVWMREISGKTTDNGSARSYMEGIRNATVTILSYGVRLQYRVNAYSST